MKKTNAWLITNRGGENLKPLNYFGYRLPIFFTKKEATARMEEMNAEDEQNGKNRGGASQFRRQVLSCTITYTLPIKPKKSI